MAKAGSVAPTTENESIETAPSEEESTEYESFESATGRNPRRVHDGLFLRLGIGFGYASASRSAEATVRQGSGVVDTGKAEQSFTGLGQLFEVSVGGSVAPGVALGAGLFGTHVYSTHGKVSLTFTGGVGEDLEAEEDVGSSTLVFLCPFVNIYYNANSGFNSIAGPCFATASIGDDDDLEQQNGFGFNVGIGGDWFVSDTWSLGFLARFQYASVSYEDNEPFSVIIPGALFTATYN